MVMGEEQLAVEAERLALEAMVERGMKEENVQPAQAALVNSGLCMSLGNKVYVYILGPA